MVVTPVVSKTRRKSVMKKSVILIWVNQNNCNICAKLKSIFNVKWVIYSHPLVLLKCSVCALGESPTLVLSSHWPILLSHQSVYFKLVISLAHEELLIMRDVTGYSQVICRPRKCVRIFNAKSIQCTVKLAQIKPHWKHDNVEKNDLTNF